MHYPTRYRNAQIRFYMRIMIPHQRSHAISTSETGFLQSLGQAASSAVDVAVGAAMQGMIRQAANDILLREDPARSLKNVRERQRVIHHRALHRDPFAIRNCRRISTSGKSQ